MKETKENPPAPSPSELRERYRRTAASSLQSGEFTWEETREFLTRWGALVGTEEKAK